MASIAPQDSGAHILATRRLLVANSSLSTYTQIWPTSLSGVNASFSGTLTQARANLVSASATILTAGSASINTLSSANATISSLSTLLGTINTFSTTIGTASTFTVAAEARLPAAIYVGALPTSDPADGSGRLWNNSNVVTIAT